jgi:hypothetical protein
MKLSRAILRERNLQWLVCTQAILARARSSKSIKGQRLQEGRPRHNMRHHYDDQRPSRGKLSQRAVSSLSLQETKQRLISCFSGV